MPIIRAVVVNELHEEPAPLLGSGAWETLLNEARVFKEEQDACRASFENVDWKSETLAEAASGCSKCGEHAESGDVFEAGPPKGNRNAWKHGGRSAETIQLRRAVNLLARSARGERL